MTKGYELPLHLAEAVKREVGEQPVLWVGQPDASKVFWATAWIWLFGIPWLAFTLFWEALAISPFLTPWLIAKSSVPAAAKTASIFMVMWGIPFVAIGVAMVSAPWIGSWHARNQAHVVTARSLYTITAWHNGSIKVERTSMGRILNLDRSERRSGFGDLTLNRGKKRDSDGDMVSDTVTWCGIPDVRRVDEIINALIDAPNPPRKA
ncbi:MAG: hypothetical protein K2Y05_10520 [Hyphomicrobiaceae bacterium]|nr:hypothetical protein [Hyphomicrobiaceae bacterium]